MLVKAFLCRHGFSNVHDPRATVKTIRFEPVTPLEAKRSTGDWFLLGLSMQVDSQVDCQELVLGQCNTNLSQACANHPLEHLLGADNSETA